MIVAAGINPMMKQIRFGGGSSSQPVYTPGWQRTLKTQLAPSAYEAERLKFLTQKWDKLAQQLVIPDAVSKTAFQELLAGYAAPSPQVGLPRVYHSLDHLTDVLTLLDAYQQDATNPPLQNPGLVEAALWLHDVVDERQYPTGVDESAQAVADFLKQSTDPQIRSSQSVDTAVRLVMQTKYGAPPAGPMTLDEQVLTDIDLSILGQDAATYDAYTQQVHQEYAFVDLAVRKVGRAKVLEGILQRQPLYQTPWGQRHFEANAQANLKRELVILKTP
jgi:predicted metal-dependent HD superfamily phosphohydrolase